MINHSLCGIIRLQGKGKHKTTQHPGSRVEGYVMEKYNQYSHEYICKLIKMGQELSKAGRDFDSFVYESDYSVSKIEFIGMGYNNPDWKMPEPKEYYRIGEPAIGYDDCYCPSRNYAEDRPEAGVSVVTKAWLHSLKSVFFGTSNDKLRARGIYKIYGFELPQKGGDDETLVCPLDWAEKTNIKTLNGLEKAVDKISE